MAATLTFNNPAGIMTPVSRYSHACVVSGRGVRWLLVSGQVGIRPDGSVPEDGAAQIDQAIANVTAILESNGMGLGDVAKLTAYLTSSALIGPWRAARDRVFAGAGPPASTLLVVAGLASPEYRFELEAVAAA